MKHLLRLTFFIVGASALISLYLSCEPIPKKESLSDIILFESEWNLDTIVEGKTTVAGPAKESVSDSLGDDIRGVGQSYKIDFGSTAAEGTKTATLYYLGDITGYNQLSFWIKADNDGAKGPNFQFVDTELTLVSSSDAVLKNTPENTISKEWSQITIPLLNKAAYEYGGTEDPDPQPIFIISNSASTTGAFYIDDVILSQASTPPITGLSSMAKAENVFQYGDGKTVLDLGLDSVFVNYQYDYETVVLEGSETEPVTKTKLHSLGVLPTWDRISWSSSASEVLSFSGNSLSVNDVGTTNIMLSYSGRSLSMFFRVQGKSVAGRLYLYGDEKDANDSLGSTLVADLSWNTIEVNRNLKGEIDSAIKEAGFTGGKAGFNNGYSDYTYLKRLTASPYGARGSDTYMEFIGDYALTVNGGLGDKKLNGVEQRKPENYVEKRNPRIFFTSADDNLDLSLYDYLVFYIKKPETLATAHQHAKFINFEFVTSKGTISPDAYIDIADATSDNWTQFRLDLSTLDQDKKKTTKEIKMRVMEELDNGGGDHNFLVDEIYLCKSAEDAC